MRQSIAEVRCLALVFGLGGVVRCCIELSVVGELVWAFKYIYMRHTKHCRKYRVPLLRMFAAPTTAAWN